MARVRSTRRRNIRDWNDVHFSLEVAQAGSFHGAATRLGVHQTTVARRIQRLERELSTRLFVRRAHGMELTNAGKTLIEKATAMENAMTTARNEVAGMDARIAGPIAIATPEGIGRYWLTPVLAEFEQRYPEVSLQVFTEMRTPGSSLNDVDVTICMERPQLPRLIALHVGQARYNLFASRNYIRRHGFPTTVEELRAHKVVDLFLFRSVAQLAWWNDLVAVTNSPALVTDSSTVCLAAIQEGVGVGMLPSFCKFVVPELIVLPLEPQCHTELWLVRHEATRTNVKINVLNEFLKTQFARDRTRWFS